MCSIVLIPEQTGNLYYNLQMFSFAVFYGVIFNFPSTANRKQHSFCRYKHAPFINTYLYSKRAIRSESDKILTSSYYLPS